MATVKVLVRYIQNVATGDDPGNELEFYGQLWARRVSLSNGAFQPIGDRKYLFNTSNGQLTEVSQGSFHHPNTPAAEFAMEPGEFLVLGGQLIEVDTIGPDDVMWPAERYYPVDALPLDSDWVIRFQESNQILDATYGVTVVR